MSNEDIKDVNHRLFKEYFDRANARILYNTEQRDKLVISISTALLVLSIESSRFFNYSGSFLELLLACVLFFCSIATVLMSFYCGSRANKLSILYAEEYYINGKEEFREKENIWSERTIYCNNIAMVTCLLGFFTIVSVLLFNINKEIKMSELKFFQDGAESVLMIKKAKESISNTNTVALSKKGAESASIPAKPVKQETAPTPIKN